MSPVEWSQLSERTICVVPIFNESPVLATVLDSLLEVFPHVICIDDGSTDHSAEIAQERGVRVVRHVINIGQGGALQTAFSILHKERKFDYLITFDADGQHSPEDARRMLLELYDSGYDIVFATRFGGKCANEIPLIKRLILKSVVRFNRAITDVNLSDTHNGLRALRLRVVPALDITHFGMAHATELVSKALQAKLRYTEVSVRIKYSEYSKRKGQSMLNSINILLDFLWR